MRIFKYYKKVLWAAIALVCILTNSPIMAITDTAVTASFFRKVFVYPADCKFCLKDAEADLKSIPELANIETKPDEIVKLYPEFAHLTPLQLAITLGRTKVAELLMQHGANPKIQNSNGQTLLHLAITHGHLDTAKLLLENQAEIDALDKNKNSPLHFAAANGNADTVKLLLEKHADIDARNQYGKTPLDYLAENGLLDSIKKNLDSDDYTRRTPLHLAVANGDLNTVKTLLKNHANIEIQDRNYQTPLHLASERGLLAMVEVLLNNGADAKVQDRNGQNPLHLAAQSGHLKVVIRLLATTNINNVDNPDNVNQTPLHLAAEKGHMSIVETLLDNGANIEAQEENGRTPLHLAIENGCFEVVQKLLDRGASTKIQDKSGQTPLHLAAQCTKYNYNVNAFIALLEYCSSNNINIKDKKGCTPLYLAIENGEFLLAKILLAHKANINIISKGGQAPLHLADIVDMHKLPPQVDAVLGPLPDSYREALSFIRELIEHDSNDYTGVESSILAAIKNPTYSKNSKEDDTDLKIQISKMRDAYNPEKVQKILALNKGYVWDELSHTYIYREELFDWLLENKEKYSHYTQIVINKILSKFGGDVKAIKNATELHLDFNNVLENRQFKLDQYSAYVFLGLPKLKKLRLDNAEIHDLICFTDFELEEFEFAFNHHFDHLPDSLDKLKKIKKIILHIDYPSMSASDLDNELAGLKRKGYNIIRNLNTIYIEYLSGGTEHEEL